MSVFANIYAIKILSIRLNKAFDIEIHNHNHVLSLLLLIFSLPILKLRHTDFTTQPFSSNFYFFAFC